jgi:hypothetical protein
MKKSVLHMCRKVDLNNLLDACNSYSYYIKLQEALENLNTELLFVQKQFNSNLYHENEFVADSDYL